MKKISDILSIISLIVCLGSCASMVGKVRLVPKYDGVDPKLQSYTQEWLNLAKDRGITFPKGVSIGFETINKGSTVGQCWYGGFWREIDIDVGYWKILDENEKDSLLWHELTHCYCGRKHDYGKDKEYGDDVKKAAEVVDGFYPLDGCPKSIMYPEVVDSYCIEKHLLDYETEMFDRCEPY